jgi:enterochelin esterase family protein
MSPEVHPDRRVTLRLRAPNAAEVLVSGEFAAKPQPLVKDENGIWSITLGPLEPDVYGYNFRVDGTSLNDPHNPSIKAGVAGTSSLVSVPGSEPLPWDEREVPHGVLHRHFYKSNVIGDQRSIVVYTPPGYSPRSKYPVLYLLHGSGDLSTSWADTGKANFILDNLLATGRAKPMLVVMPFGHAVSRSSPESRVRNTELFSKDLLEVIIPAVENSYSVIANKSGRAIAGLSMGGGQALWAGLNHPDVFGAVGAFSSAVPQNLPMKVNNQLLWIAIGKDDFLLEVNRKLDAALRSAGVKYAYKETEGAHSWRVWRRYLSELVPVLFR